MGDVVEFTGLTIVPDDPSASLEKAKPWGLARVLIIGADADGNLLFGGSHSEVAENNWLLDKAKQQLLAIP